MTRIANHLYQAVKVPGPSVAFLLVSCSLLAPRRHAQSQAARIEPEQFEVATIKRTTINCLGGDVPPLTWAGGRLSAECLTLERLIRTSYTTGDDASPDLHVDRVEVLGGPAWVRSDSY